MWKTFWMCVKEYAERWCDRIGGMFFDRSSGEVYRTVVQKEKRESVRVWIHAEYVGRIPEACNRIGECFYRSSRRSRRTLGTSVAAEQPRRRMRLMR
jgi:hypothetical protein